MAKDLKRRPERFEDIKGVGPKRAEKLRREFGSYENLTSHGRNAVKNKLAGVVSGNRRNLPQFAENIVDSTRRESVAADAVDSSLVSTTETGRTVKSKTLTERANENQDRSDLGFSTQERPEEDVEAAFNIFREQYDDTFDVPARELGQAASDDTRATGQPLIGAATSRVTFARGATADDFKSELESATENVSEKRATRSPGELTDSFVGFVESKFGFEQSFGDFDIDRREYERAQDFQKDRSPKSQRVDSRRRAPVTDEISTWKSDPSHFDYPGIDTPTESPAAKEKDAPFADVDDSLF